MGYFKPLRRKIGVLTLVLALVIWLFGWVHQSFDRLCKSFERHERSSGISKSWWGTTTWEYSIDITPVPPQVGIERAVYELLMNYWIVVIPLTLLAAYLLLSRPRAQASRPTHA